MIASIDVVAEPLEIPLTADGEAFWLDSRTIAYASQANNQGTTKSLYSLSFQVNANSGTIRTSQESSTWVGDFPTSSATNFRYTSRSDYLVFSDEVYEDGDITKLMENDEAWDERPHSAYVFDTTYARHVSLFSPFLIALLKWGT